MLRRLVLLALCLALPGLAAAQAEDRPNTILVLDASGSMWGQIDGVNKIVIAREVIADLLADLPDEASLGLTVYGHRQRGSCTDIETVVAPAPFTQGAILDAVNSINPRGRTPMTDSVVAAAEALRHTEEAATVILVSDGIENCNPDPCAMAAALEASGVGFTAHVIGFDVSGEAEARAQMQCIADNTGGLFLTADNAEELADALGTVVAAAPPPPVVAEPVRIEARTTPSSALPTRPIGWTLLREDGEVLVIGEEGPTLSAELLPGSYIARATRAEPDGPVSYQSAFTVDGPMDGPVLVAMPDIIDTAPVTFSARVMPGATFPASALVWTLYDADGAARLGPVELPGGTLPLEPGDYRLEVLRVSQGTTHETRFTVAARQPQDVVIDLPALAVDIRVSARIGSETGPLVPDPVLWEVPADTPDPGTGAEVILPLTRGAYSVTAYWTAQEIEATADFVVVDQPREIVLVFPEPGPSASLTAPATAVAGSMIEVGWTGPDGEGDYIGIGATGARSADQWRNYTYTSEGAVLPLLVPPEPGAHVIAYFTGADRTAIATLPITVTPVEVTLTAPDSAVAGGEMEVGWTGPDYDGDYIGIGAVGARSAGQWERYAYTAEGSPATLALPTEPGNYLVTYFLAQDRTPVAQVPVTLTPFEVTLSAPASAGAGTQIAVDWTGPDYDGDYIGIGAVGARSSGQWETYAHTADGAPAALAVPTAPGDYLVTYFTGADRRAVTSVPLTVTATGASLTAPASAVAGSQIEVGWTGPDFDGDYIGIGAVGARSSGQWENFAYTEDGAPAALLIPVTPGDYVIRYFLGQDRSSIAEVPITITEAEASVTAPASAVAGSVIEVGWTGPAYDGDYIGIGEAGARSSGQWTNWVAVADGNPVALTVPMTTGPHVIQYFAAQDRIPLAQASIEVTEAAASLTGPQTAVAGSTIEVGWTGPAYDGDYVGIGLAGASGSGRWENWVDVAEGTPVQLLVPGRPGDYRITYFAAQDRTALTEIGITVTAVPASLTAPDSGKAGEEVEVGWTGPNYPGDYIGIGRVGATGSGQWASWAYTADGNPVRLTLPEAPGDYVIQYFLDQDRLPVAQRPITVQ